MLPIEWFEKSESLIVTNLPTHFGPIDFKLKKELNKLTLNFSPKFHTNPREVSIRFQRPVIKMILDGKESVINATKIIIPNKSQEIEFRLEPS